MSSTDLKDWLEELGLGKYLETFTHHEIDIEVLFDLDDDDLKSMDVALGARKKILRAIELGSAARPPLLTGSLHQFDAERRQVTVVFCDLVGSTELSVRLDPEDFSDIILRYQDCCETIVKRFDGHVAGYLGDGAMIYFGYPIAHERDPERAVWTALEIIAALKDLPMPLLMPLQTRIGVATGEVVVGGMLGKGTNEEHFAWGQTPNLAARLQVLAQPNSVVVSDTTRRLIGDAFYYTDLGKHQLKGFNEIVQTWGVKGKRFTEHRIRTSENLSELTCLVGRDTEAASLRESWRRTRSERGQAVLIDGEPGIGKSRLVELACNELCENAHVIRLYSSPYYRNSTLYPLAEHIRLGAGLDADDSPSEQLTKVHALLRDCGLDDDENVMLLAGLLSIPRKANAYEDWSASKTKERTLQLLQGYLLSYARTQTVLIAFEDLHWLDATTIELLDRCIRCLDDHHIMFMLSARPEFAWPWLDKSRVSRLTLGRLDHTEAASIINAVANGKMLPRPVLTQVLEKTDGVPLFIEELTKTVLEGGFLEECADHYELHGSLPLYAVPSTLSDSLMARLDRLAPVKEIAQIGATMGRDFDFDLLKAISSLSSNRLKAGLAQLVEAELIFENPTTSGTVYRFKHALVQDAAYTSMLRVKRQALHKRIAQVINVQFPELAKTRPELLAHHYEGAGLIEEAIKFLDEAGELAIRRYALSEASEHLARGLELLLTLPETAERNALEISLQTKLGPTLLVVKGYGAPEVEATFERARHLCAISGRGPELFLSLRGLWAFYFVRGSLQTAREISDELVELANRERKPAYLLEAHRALGMTTLYRGEFALAARHLTRGAEIYDPNEHAGHAFKYGNDPGVVCLSYGSKALWSLGKPSQALKDSKQALRLADAVSHPFSQCQAQALSAMLHSHRNAPLPTRQYAEAAIALTPNGEFPYFRAIGEILRGWAVAKLLGSGAGIEQLQSGLDAYALTGSRLAEPWFRTLLAEVYGEIQRAQEGLQIIAEALTLAHTNQEGYYLAELYRVKGTLLELSGDCTQAEAAYLEAVRVATEQDANGWLLRAASQLGEFWIDKGRQREAHALLQPIYERCDSLQSSPDVLRARQTLARSSAHT